MRREKHRIVPQDFITKKKTNSYLKSTTSICLDTKFQAVFYLIFFTT